MTAPLPPVAITVAPNGSYKTKADHPALPVTPDELARCAAACREAGAAMFHLHVRDRDGAHLLDADAYGEATRAIRQAVGADMIVQPTSEAAGRYQPAEQITALLATRPEAVSLAVRELVRSDDDLPAASAFIEALDGFETMIQVILYSEDDLRAYRDLRRRGAFGSRPQTLLFVLGRYTAGQVSAPSDLVPFLKQPPEAPFAVCAFGPRERDCVLAAALLGGHARVGFENNLYLPNGTLAADNAQLVAGLAQPLQSLGHALAIPDDIRAQYR